jgi:hypothetical protein
LRKSPLDQDSFLDRDRQCGAPGGRGAYVTGHVRGRARVAQDYDPVLVALVEHIDSGEHALPGREAYVLIDLTRTTPHRPL